jgi:hypothetical protein
MVGLFQGGLIRVNIDTGQPGKFVIGPLFDFYDFQENIDYTL